jgi:hypothetical protein
LALPDEEFGLIFQAYPFSKRRGRSNQKHESTRRTLTTLTITHLIIVKPVCAQRIERNYAIFAYHNLATMLLGLSHFMAEISLGVLRYYKRWRYSLSITVKNTCFFDSSSAFQA